MQDAYYYDLLRSLEWLVRAKDMHAQGWPQTKIDGRALRWPQMFQQEFSSQTRALYEDALTDAFDYPHPGNPEACVSNASRIVIEWSTEAEWACFADGLDPDRVARFRAVWDEIRAPMRREDQIMAWASREWAGGPDDYRKELTDNECAGIDAWFADLADAWHCRAGDSPEGHCTEHSYAPQDLELDM